MGDDIQAARVFADMCKTHMDALISGTLTNAESRDCLEEIDRQAKSLHARAICRVSRQARDDFKYHDATPQSHGNLLALNKLIRQYEAGLVEVETELSQPSEGPTDAAGMDMATASHKAVATLRTVLGHARPGRERNALEKLIQFDPSAPGIPGEYVTVATLMPTLTDHILREARQQGKSVSLSLAGEGATLAPDMLLKLEAVLSEIGCNLVRQTVEAPDIRRQKGLSQSAHIAMTAQNDGQSLHILISVDGVAPGRTILKSNLISTLTRLGMQSGLKQQAGAVQIALADIPLSITRTVRASGSNSSHTRELRA